MTIYYPTSLQNDIEAITTELKEVESSISKFRWLKHQLEEQIATYSQAAAPLHKLSHLRETKESLDGLRAKKERLEADKAALESELEQKKLLEEERYRLESGETLKPTGKNLQRLIEETEALIMRGDDTLLTKLASYYCEQAQLSEARGEGEDAVRALERATELYRQTDDDTNFLVTRNKLIGLLLRQGNRSENLGEAELALKKYLHALDLIRVLDDTEREIDLLGTLTRFFESLGEIKNALNSRLDRIDCLIYLERTAEINAEIRSIRRLCRQFESKEAKKSWIKAAYKSVETFFIGENYLEGIEFFSNSLNDEFDLDELINDFEVATETILREIEKREIEPQII